MKLRVVLAGLICGLVAVAAENGQELFQRVVTLEKANGNLGEAIKLYHRVAKEFSSDRALAAKALIQAAHCYELLGQDEQAVKIYEQVTRDFGDQRQPVETARAKLASLRFEVASVGKTMPDARGGYSSPRSMGGPGTSLPSEINYVNLRLETLIETAYDLKEYQLVGPDWLRSTDSEPFFISATIRQGATREQVNQMLRNLLAEQFKLTVHRETRDLPFYELALVRRGPKLKESLKERAGKDGESLRPARLAGAAASLGLLEEKDGFLRLPAGAIRPAFGGPAATWATPPVQHAVGGNQNIAGLVTYLSHASELYYGRPVVDKTGLTGNWDYNLEYAQGAGPANSPGLPSDSAPDLITAVRDQLGFKMEPKKGPIEVLVVDHIEKTFPQVFEVASNKAPPEPTMAMISTGQMRQRIDDGLVDLQNISLMNLISMAYETNRDYITGPSWLEGQNFSVTAKLPAGSSKSQVPAMLQRMLAEALQTGDPSRREGPAGVPADGGQAGAEVQGIGRHGDRHKEERGKAGRLPCPLDHDGGTRPKPDRASQNGVDDAGGGSGARQFPARYRFARAGSDRLERRLRHRPGVGFAHARQGRTRWRGCALESPCRALREHLPGAGRDGPQAGAGQTRL